MTLITFFDQDPAKVRAMEAAFAGQPILTLCAPFKQIGFDGLTALVSPANSFGIMDGGLDAAIIARFGTEVQQAVMERIFLDFAGEQPVGTALHVPIGDGSSDPCYLIHAPTMRVPMRITRTDNVYNAMRAVLLCARRLGVHSIACPALGMGTGGMPPAEAARQMRVAWDHINLAHSMRGPVASLQEGDAWQRRLGLGLGGDPERW